MRDIAQTKIRLSIRVLLAQPNEDATEILASTAYVIGMVAQTCVNTHGYDDTPWLRQLHGALRAIQDMCLTHGYTIPAGQGLALQRALEVALEHMPETFSHPTHAANGWVQAKWLRAVIEQHKITRDTIPDAKLLKA